MKAINRGAQVTKQIAYTAIVANVSAYILDFIEHFAKNVEFFQTFFM
jgi:hypothetical protein